MLTLLKSFITYLCFFTISVLTFNLPAYAALISEFEPNPYGPDSADQYIELFGEVNTEFNNLTLLAIEADRESNIGKIDQLISGVSGRFDEQGIATFSIEDLENPSFVLMLLIDSIFSVGDDLDTNNDGLLDDLSLFSNVTDAIGIFDANPDYNLIQYANEVGGTSFSYSGDEPKLVFRDSVTTELFALNDPDNQQVYNSNGLVFEATEFNFSTPVNTFGEINPTRIHAVPEPSILWLMLISFLFVNLRSRPRLTQIKEMLFLISGRQKAMNL